MPANMLTNPPNITDAAKMVEYANEGVNYLLGPIALLVVFLICLITFSMRPNSKPETSITASLWITTILSVYMTTVPNLLDGTITLFLIVVTGLSSILLWRNDR